MTRSSHQRRRRAIETRSVEGWNVPGDVWVAGWAPTLHLKRPLSRRRPLRARLRWLRACALVAGLALTATAFEERRVSHAPNLIDASRVAAHGPGPAQVAPQDAAARDLWGFL